MCATPHIANEATVDQHNTLVSTQYRAQPCRPSAKGELKETNAFSHVLRKRDYSRTTPTDVFQLGIELDRVALQQKELKETSASSHVPRKRDYSRTTQHTCLNSVYSSTVSPFSKRNTDARVSTLCRARSCRPCRACAQCASRRCVSWPLSIGWRPLGRRRP